VQPAGAEGFARGLNSLHRLFGYRGVFDSLGEMHHSNALVAEAHGPLERHRARGWIP
jgi:hypothetical protein